MAKIGGKGGGLGFNSGPAKAGVPRDPYLGLGSPLNRTTDAPGVSWFSAGRAIASSLAVTWFDQYPSVTLGDYLDASAVNDGAASVVKNHLADTNRHWLEDPVIPGLFDGVQSLGEFVPISQSSLGAKVLAFLEGRGVTGTHIPVIAFGGMVVEFDQSSRGGLSWAGPWGTVFGSRAFNRFEIYRDSEGVEWCYVHTNLAVATRKPSEVNRAFCRYSFVPRSLHSQLFIAETPFPSSIMSMGRGMAYPDLPEHLFPRPLVSIDDFGVVTYTEGETDRAGNLQHQFISMPHVIRAGFAFSAEAEPHFENLIPTVVDAVTNLSTIAEDGFRNYRGPEVDLPYDYVYGSEYVQEQEGILPGTHPVEGATVAGHSRFVPELMLGPLIETTERALWDMQQSDDPSHKRVLLEWVVSEGAGRYVASAINTLCYSFLLPEGNFDLAEELLGIAIDLDQQFEATNAMCNLGQVKHARGDSESAIEVLEAALERPDKFAEAEASFHLGIIYSERGDSARANEYWERGARADTSKSREYWESDSGEEGQKYEDFATRCREKLGETSSPLPKFCSQCGTGFSQGAKFCANCGAAVSP